MGELSEFYHSWNEQSKQKRKSNRENALIQLQNYDFKLLNNGSHIQFVNFDFWPGTGLFRHRVTGKSGRGIKNLIRKLDN